MIKSLLLCSRLLVRRKDIIYIAILEFIVLW